MLHSSSSSGSPSRHSEDSSDDADRVNRPRSQPSDQPRWPKLGKTWIEYLPPESSESSNTHSAGGIKDISRPVGRAQWVHLGTSINSASPQQSNAENTQASSDNFLLPSAYDARIHASSIITPVDKEWTPDSGGPYSALGSTYAPIHGGTLPRESVPMPPLRANWTGHEGCLKSNSGARTEVTTASTTNGVEDKAKGVHVESDSDEDQQKNQRGRNRNKGRKTIRSFDPTDSDEVFERKRVDRF